VSRRFWSELVERLEPYVPGEQPQVANLLKLNTNEAAYGPSPRVLEALASVDGDDLVRYPDPRSQVLCQSIAAYHGLDESQVFVGNGSDEVLAHVFQGLLRQQRELLFPDISYSFYPVWAQLYGIHYRQVALDGEFSIRPRDYSASAAAVILPNPNAPTGRLLGLEVLREFLAESNRLLVVDEAYIDFGGETAVPLLADYDNLLIVRTLSKSRSLAGLRVGYALGSPELMEALVRVKDSFNSYPLDVVAQRAAVASFGDEAWFQDCCQRVIRSREMLVAGLEALEFDVLPSAANFVFCRHRRVAGDVLFGELRRRGIIVRRWDSERIRDYLRISVGTDAQVERLLANLEEILAG